MQGKKAGFCTLLGEAIGRDILCHHCLAHKVQLILRAVNFKKGKDPACENCILTEKYFNKVASFYGQSDKRLADLKSFCEEHGYKVFAPKLTFPVRWVQSHYDSNFILFHHFKPLVEHLSHLQTIPLFEKDKKTIDLAEKYQLLLTHKFVLFTLVVVLDLMDVFKGASKVFQISGSSILGQPDQKIRLLNGIRSVKNKNGSFLKALLSEAKCGDASCRTLDSFLDSDDVKWWGIPLHQKTLMEVIEGTYVTFDSPTVFFEKYLDALEDELENYMPDSVLMETMSNLDQRRYAMHLTGNWELTDIF